MKAARRSIKHVKRCYLADKKGIYFRKFSARAFGARHITYHIFGLEARKKQQRFCVRGFGRVSTSRWNS